MDFMSDCEVGTRELAQEDAAAMATEGVENLAESEQTISCSDTPRDRGAHVCCRASVSGSAPTPASASVSLLGALPFKSFKSSESFKKVGLPEIPTGIVVFCFKSFRFPF